MDAPRRALVLLDVAPQASGVHVVDAVCRAVLAARRQGCEVRVRAGEDLRRLLELLGLGDVLAVSGEPQRQAETGEDRLAEEGVDVGDPPS